MNVKKKATFSPPQKQPFRILFKPIIKFNKLINFSHCRVKILLIKNSQLLLDRTIFFKSKKKKLGKPFLSTFINIHFHFRKIFFARRIYTLSIPFFPAPFFPPPGFDPPFFTPRFSFVLGRFLRKKGGDQLNEQQPPLLFSPPRYVHQSSPWSVFIYRIVDILYRG